MAATAPSRSEREGSGTRRMIGTDPDAIEAWAFDPLALEALLKRLSAHKRVVLLSGDVHYSSANELRRHPRAAAVGRGAHGLEQRRGQGLRLQRRA